MNNHHFKKKKKTAQDLLYKTYNNWVNNLFQFILLNLSVSRTPPNHASYYE